MPSATGPRTSGECLLIHDFGVVRPGAVLTHDFVVSNQSGSMRYLVGVRQGCTCVAATPQQREIPPFGNLRVPVKYRVGGTTHDERKSVALMFAGHPHPVELVVTARVRKPLTISVPRVDLPVEGGTPAVFAVSNYSDRDWRGFSLAGIDWLDSEVTPLSMADLADVDAPRQRWRVVLQLRAGVEADFSRGVAPLKATALDDAECSDTLLVGWDRRPPLEAVPHQLNFGHCRRGASISRSVELRLTRGAVGETPRISSASDAASSVSWKLAQRSTAVWNLEVSFVAELLGPLETSLTIQVPGVPDVVLPIRGLVVAGDSSP